MGRFKEAKSQIEVWEKAFSASEQAVASVAEREGMEFWKRLILKKMEA